MDESVSIKQANVDVSESGIYLTYFQTFLNNSSKLILLILYIIDNINYTIIFIIIFSLYIFFQWMPTIFLQKCLDVEENWLKKIPL